MFNNNGIKKVAGLMEYSIVKQEPVKIFCEILSKSVSIFKSFKR